MQIHRPNLRDSPRDSCAHGSSGGTGRLTCEVHPDRLRLNDDGEFCESALAWNWMPAACGYGGPLSSSCCHWAVSRTAQTSQVVLGKVRPRTKGSGLQAASGHPLLLTMQSVPCPFLCSC